MTSLTAAHGALTTLLSGASLTGVDKVAGYEDPNLYGQGKVTVTVSFGNPVMDGTDYHLAVRVYSSWANSFATAHANFLTAIQSVETALSDDYQRGSWLTGANVEVNCFVATIELVVGRDDF